MVVTGRINKRFHNKIETYQLLEKNAYCCETDQFNKSVAECNSCFDLVSLQTGEHENESLHDSRSHKLT